jgi:tryptophanyl-tRNA synthetase
MARAFSGIQPSGDVHLGNYLGAIRRWAREQHNDTAVYCIVDLHALTLQPDPSELESNTITLTQILVAAGLDPDVVTLFVQSQVHEHTELAWLMECTASFGELRRMHQFKEKSDQAEFVSAGLFTYPALQAADILLYDTDQVPVGDDQRQHLELVRDLALRFNNRYGQTFVVPEHVIPPVAARVMDLQNPTTKMSKSQESPQGTVGVLEDPRDIERKFKRAVTDSGTEVVYDPETKPGVSNLLAILAAATDATPADLAGNYTRYASLKQDCADAVVELLRPLRQRYEDLASDPETTRQILNKGAEKAQSRAAETMRRVRERVGLPPRD